ncbi:MAG: phytanoyl-CoA dioxygenase family protein [Cytophagales bacterium]|nr:phytanoyl-CoA dioxygenase family protein [Cytophagales bacterium]
MTTLALSAEQKQFFLKNGYLHLPKAIPDQLVNKWQSLLKDHNRDSFDLSDPFIARNISFLEMDNPRFIARINNLMGHYPEEVLELLAHEAILNIAESLCGNDAIPMQCDVLFKHAHSSSNVLWHQDAIYPRIAPYLNIGFYLDDANHEDGCLKLIPGSQSQRQNIKSISRNQEKFIIEIPANAGDLIVHDLMIVHSSLPKKTAGVRRTLYMEWWSESAAIGHGSFSKKWIYLLKNWKALLTNRSAKQYQKNGSSSSMLPPESQVIEQILELREQPIPANYGFQ